MADVKLIIEKMGALADRSGTAVQFAWKNDLLGIYILGSQFAVGYASRGQWVNAVFTVLLEDIDNFKAELDKTLNELAAPHEIRTKELWGLSMAQINVRIFASSS